MSIRTCIARAFCVVLTAGFAAAPDPATARESAARPDLERRSPLATGIVSSPRARTGTGFRLDRPSKGDVRIWRAIEEVVADSHPSGQPRSPTLRRLWEWARTSTHVLHVEMVSPSKVPAGMVGVFRIERADPAGQSHVTVIRLCPLNIRRAAAAPAPDSVDSFVRFEGLTEVERFAEVLAHELAHAEYVLESSERLARVQASQRAIDEYFSGKERVTKRLLQEIGQRLREPLAVLAATEAHAESVEAVVLRELAGDRPARTAIGQAR